MDGLVQEDETDKDLSIMYLYHIGQVEFLSS